MRYKHYCAEWDYMLISEKDDEFACCTCFDTEEFRKVREEKYKEIYETHS